jgi:GTP cyclohydrolase II
VIDTASDLMLARAVDDLRRGEIVRITDGALALDILAAELADADTLAALETAGRADLLLTPERAQTLNILNQRPAAGADAIAITRMPWLDLVTSLSTADPASDLAQPFKGPFPTGELGSAATAAAAGLVLAKRAALLPALFAVPAAQPAPSRIEVEPRALPSSAAPACRSTVRKTPASSPSALPMAAQSIWRSS